MSIFYSGRPLLRYSVWSWAKHFKNGIQRMIIIRVKNLELTSTVDGDVDVSIECKKVMVKYNT